MKRSSVRNRTANPLLAWSSLAVKTGEMMMASAQVISHRTGRIAMAGPTPNERDRREFALMGQEKLEAAAEATQAMAARMLSLNQQLGTLAFKQMMAGTSGIMSLVARPTLMLLSQVQADLVRDAIENSAAVASHLADSVVKVAHKGLRPIHSRATANAKRLARLKS